MDIYNYTAKTIIFLTLITTVSVAAALVFFTQKYRSLKNTNRRLQMFSEWALGHKIVAEAVKDQSIFSLRRTERTIMFVDIRGFTRWSAIHQPEFIVSVLNGYYLLAERIILDHKAIHIKFAGDEVMAVFDSAERAIHTALELKREIGTFLNMYNLSAGIGLNTGPVIEGLLGGTTHKEYDLVGNTVNKAKRIESATQGGSLTISQSTYDCRGKVQCQSTQTELTFPDYGTTELAYRIINRQRHTTTVHGNGQKEGIPQEEYPDILPRPVGSGISRRVQ